MAIGTGKELYVQLTESIITGSISAKLSVYRHADTAVMPSCNNILSSLTRIHLKSDVVSALLLCMHFPVFTRLQPVFG